MMSNAPPQPESKVRPIRVIDQHDHHRREAKAGGVDDLVEFRAFYTRDVLLFGAVAGPADGTPVILLHGFPDFWLGWARQIRPLVEAGYRVIIPDQRGYNRSEKPPNIADYHLPELGGDIVDLIDAAELQRPHLVGHDWGGGVSWWLAEHHPQHFETVTILNCPHPDVLGRALMLNHPRQMLRSWYIALFQLPAIPEFLARFGDCRLLELALLSATDEAFSDRELDMYRNAWSQDRAITSMLHWYRAAGRAVLDNSDKQRSSHSNPRIEVPLQIIWGKDDKALDRSLVEPSAELAVNSDITWMPQATHWVQRDCPQQVSQRLLEMFRSADSP